MGIPQGAYLDNPFDFNKLSVRTATLYRGRAPSSAHAPHGTSHERRREPDPGVARRCSFDSVRGRAREGERAALGQ